MSRLPPYDVDRADGNGGEYGTRSGDVTKIYLYGHKDDIEFNASGCLRRSFVGSGRSELL